MLRVLETKTRQLHFCSCLAIQRKGGVHEKREQEKDYILGGIKMKNNNRPATQTTHYGNQGNLYLYVTEKLGF